MKTSNKLIAKNSLYLYIRTFLSIIVTLYTSRIFLDAIGIEGYGIYNLVGGIVAFFSILQSLISGATQRFLNIEIGNKNYEQENKILNISIIIIAVLAVCIFILAETIGLWLIQNKLNFPSGKEHIAVIVYHISVFTTIISLFKVPYTAYILAHERMSFFAYITLIEIVSKLFITYLLFNFEERLITYSFMLFVMNLIVLWGFWFYCKRNIGLGNFKVYSWKNNPEYRKLLSFSVWTLVGYSATITRDQGIAILINIFFGVALNAAMGVMTQVSNVYSSLYQNLQTAFMPQIIQNCETDADRFKFLLKYCALLTFVLVGIICVPMIVHSDFILQAWLGDNVPQYTNVFVQIVMIKILIVSTSQAVYHGLLAVGQIKEIQITSCVLAVLSICFIYWGLSLGMSPTFPIIIVIVMDTLMFIVRLYYINRYTNIKALYIVSFLWKPFVLIVLIVIPLSLMLFNDTNNWLKFLFSTICIELIYIVAIYSSIEKTTRKLITCKIMKFLNKYYD